MSWWGPPDAQERAGVREKNAEERLEDRVPREAREGQGGRAEEWVGGPPCCGDGGGGCGGGARRAWGPSSMPSTGSWGCLTLS